MSNTGPSQPQRVPTLTEVVTWTERAPSAPDTAAGEAPAGADPASPSHVPISESAQQQITDHVLAEVQRQIDLMLEYRLREVLTPLLTRLGDGLVREARAELASALHDVVSRAVANELARHREPRVER